MTAKAFVLLAAMTPSTTFAQSAEAQAAFDCLLRSAITFEPHQDNMRDLAYVLVETECIQLRDAFLNANKMNHAEGLNAYKERMRSEVLAMIIAARANRLGLPRE